MDGELTPEVVAPAVRAAVLRIARRLRVERDQSALSNNKVAILSHLAREGDSTPSRISVEERQHLQSLTRPLAELESAGLISRAPDTVDGRRSVLRLTRAGRAAFDADMSLRDQWLCDELDGLDPGRLRLLADAAAVLDRVGGHRAG